MLLFAAVSVAVLSDALAYTPDSARYIAWAQSLSRFEGFVDRTQPVPLSYVVHAPLYSVALAPFMWLGANPVIAAKIGTLFTALVLLFAFRKWLRRSLSSSLALAGMFIFAFHPLTLIVSTQVLSETLFALLLILYFISADTVSESDKKSSLPALLGVIGAGAMLTREVGVAIVGAGFVYLLFRKRPIAALIALSIPLAAYALWFFRNEAIVAAAENPTLRNSQFYFSHLLTSQDSSIFTEFAARAATNATVYGKALVQLLTHSEYHLFMTRFVSPADPAVLAVGSVLSVAAYPFAAISLGLTALGIWLDKKSSAGWSMRLLFVLFYAIPVLFYPVHDVRFLFPVLIVMLYYALIGWVTFSKRVQNAPNAALWKRIALGLILLALLPNAVWSALFVRNGYLYARDPVSFYSFASSHPQRPEVLTRPFALAGEWISKRNPPGAPVLCRWKELAFHLKGSPVEVVDLVASLDYFERIIRDEGIRTVAVLNDDSQIPEFLLQMAASKRFSFRLARTIADIEIYSVSPANSKSAFALPDSAIHPRRASFLAGVRSLLAGRYAVADSVFTALGVESHWPNHVLFCTALAKEFSGERDLARKMFNHFSTLPQTGAYVYMASLHRSFLDRLDAMNDDTVSIRKAHTLLNVALNYWDLGFHVAARSLTDLAVAADSRFFPARTFHVYFALREGDTASARTYAGALQKEFPGERLAEGFASLLDDINALKRASAMQERIAIRMRIADLYLQLGLPDAAIDELLAAVVEDPNQLDLPLKLASLYASLNRPFVAARWRTAAFGVR